ncbi:copper resistance protein NlpE N-terminal domain-containing protein [Acinetobacter pittii]|uniref:copper resistance protein NlpE N-terminal domain-containing protein n=1 Tax=Acinetobacter pittii TaxID=48296 RepID=UPI003AA98D5F
MQMQKTLILSFIILSISYGCSNENSTDTSVSNESSVELKNVAPELQAWVGEYSGVIPCAPCLSFCPDCEGMGVKLIVKSDQSFELYRTSYSGHNDEQKFAGSFDFTDDEKIRIQLSGVKERSVLMLGQSAVEIVDQDSKQSYEAFHDFQLKKIA